MRNKYILLTVSVTLFTLTSCLKSLLCIRGDGIIMTETRRVTSFDQIENSTSFDVIYLKADTLGIEIRAEQNILDYIETNVYDNCLEIRTSPGSICLDYNEKPLITVTSPSLERVVNSGSGVFLADQMSDETVSVKLSGSGDISIETITGNYLDIILSGSGDIEIKESTCSNSDCLLSGSGNVTISGECDKAHYKITGSGNIYSSDLITNTASIIISGSGSIFTTIEEYLNGLISGSGNIYVSGNPEIDQTVTGSGRIIKHK